MSEIMLKPDWPEKSFDSYYQKATEQLGNHWALSDDATVATCGNLQLIWSPKFWTWFLEADGLEIGRFQIPFEPNSLIRFKRLCSANYRSE